MSDGVRLVPPGLESLFGIKSQQYSMHVDAIEKEIKLVVISQTFLYSFEIGLSLFTQFMYLSSCQSPSKYLNLTFVNGQRVMESLMCT